MDVGPALFTVPQVNHLWTCRFLNTWADTVSTFESIIMGLCLKIKRKGGKRLWDFIGKKHNARPASADLAHRFVYWYLSEYQISSDLSTRDFITFSGKMAAFHEHDGMPVMSVSAKRTCLFSPSVSAKRSWLLTPNERWSRGRSYRNSFNNTTRTKGYTSSTLRNPGTYCRTAGRHNTGNECDPTTIIVKGLQTVLILVWVLWSLQYSW